MDALRHAAGRIAHDLNNYLTAILGYGELLEGQLRDAPRSGALLAEVQRAAQRATGYTRQLQAFSGRQVLDPRRLDLNEVIRDAHPRMEESLGEDIEFTLALDATVPPVDLDQGQFECALLSLVAEAAGAMGGAGDYRLETHPAYGREGDHQGVLLHAVDSSNSSASGEDHLALEPFRSADRCGLGLAVAYGIVAQHGGSMSVSRLPTGERCLTIALRMPAD